MSETTKFEPSTYERAKEQLKSNGVTDTPSFDAHIQESKNTLGKKMAEDTVKNIHNGEIINRMEFKNNILGNESFRNTIMDVWKNGPDQKINEFLNQDFAMDLYQENNAFINSATGYEKISATSMKLTNIDGKLQLLVQQSTVDGNIVTTYEVPLGKKIDASSVLDIKPGTI